MESKVSYNRAYLQKRKTPKDAENRLVTGGEERWSGSLGLGDASWYIQDGYTTMSYCTAQKNNIPYPMIGKSCSVVSNSL